MLKKSLLLLTLAVCMAGFNGNSEAAAAKALTAKQASIVTVAAFTAQGDLPNLKTALNEALDNGMTVNEVKEVLVQMYAYCGFPRSLNGINTLIAVLDERKAAGIVDEIGRDATPVDPKRDRYAIGEKTQTELVGRPVAGIGNVNAQLTSHMRVSMNTGISAEQLQETVRLLDKKAGPATGSNAQRVLDSLLLQK